MFGEIGEDVQSVTVTPINKDGDRFVVQYWGGEPERPTELASVRVDDAPYGERGTRVEISWYSTSDTSLARARGQAVALVEAVRLAERLERAPELRSVAAVMILTDGVYQGRERR